MDPPLMKNRGKKKFLTCFSPIDTGECDDHNRNDGSHHVVAASKKKNNTKARRTFANAVKAVLSKVKKSSRNKKSRSNHRDLLSIMDEMDANEEMIRRNSDSSTFSSNSNSSSTRTTTTASTSTGSSSISRTNSVSLDVKKVPINANKNRKKSNKYLKIAMLIFLVSLVALINWGKVVAIVACTSVCLFFLPGRHRRSLNFQGEESEEEEFVDTEEYCKKKVINEGIVGNTDA